MTYPNAITKAAAAHLLILFLIISDPRFTILPATSLLGTYFNTKQQIQAQFFIKNTFNNSPHRVVLASIEFLLC